MTAEGSVGPADRRDVELRRPLSEPHASPRLPSMNEPRNASLKDQAAEILEALRTEQQARVRIAVFGQPGAGKSSLINALTGQQLADAGVRTDMTTECTTYEWGQLILADFPGYGTERFPREGYLRRFDVLSFDLFLCVTASKFTAADAELFRELKAAGKTCVFVRNVADKLWQRGRTREELEGEIVADARRQVQDDTLAVRFTSCCTDEGVAALSTTIGEHLDAARAERWARSARAHSHALLQAKLEACRRYVSLAAAAAAANGANPLPGVDVAADVAILTTLFVTLRAAYGLEQEPLPAKALTLPLVAPQITRLVTFGTKQGALMLLKQFAKRATVKQVAKYIPFLGQLVAGGLGYSMALQAGNSYLDDCHTVARALLDHELAAA